jgi:hypothetical protein
MKVRTTIGLSQAGMEGLQRIADSEFDGNASAAVDFLVHEEMLRRGYIPADQPRRYREVAIEILVGGKEQPIFQHEGEYFLPARKGSEYQVRLRNNSPKKRLFVLSVDGINVVNGENADFKGPGYVLLPWTSAVIKGFLRDNDEAAAFKFSAVSKSYSKKTGRGKANVGAIGCAVFDEVPKTGFWTYHSSGLVTPTSAVGGRGMGGGGGTYAASSTFTMSNSLGDDKGSAEYSADEISVMNCVTEVPTSGPISSDGVQKRIDPSVLKARLDSSKSSESRSFGSQQRRSSKRKRKGGRISGRRQALDFMEQDVGTEYGRKVRMDTEETTFEREDSPVQVVQLRYASIEALRSWGVPVDKKPAKRPDAFPAEGPKVPEPPGWRG